MSADKLIDLFEQMLREHWAYDWSGAEKGLVSCAGAFVYAWRVLLGKHIEHGSNWMRRNLISGELLPVSAAKPGMAAFKMRTPSQAKYALPAKYRKGGAAYTGDLNDYYHVGLVGRNGKVLNAQGTSTGFVESPISQNWCGVAYLKDIEYEGVERDMDVLYGVRVIGGKLNLRESPSTEAKRIGQLPDGELATVYMEENGWLYVKATVNGERLCGWCKQEYTERYKPADDEDEPETVKPDESDNIGQVAIRLEWNIGKALYEALKSVYGDDAK